MGTRIRKKPRLSVQVEPEDKAAITAVAKKAPWASPSDVVRTALRVGLAVLAKDQSPLGTPPAQVEPDPEPKRRSTS